MADHILDWVERNLSKFITSRKGDEWTMRCPLPDHGSADKRESASFNIVKKKFYCQKCKVGGRAPWLAKQMGIDPPVAPHRQHQEDIGRLTNTWIYELPPPSPDTAPGRSMRVLRFERDGKKTYRQSTAAPGGKWINRRPQDADWVIFKWPELARDAPTAEAVLIVEGERDVDTLTDIGLLATCNPGGGEKWAVGHSKTLLKTAPKAVVLIPDSDLPGMRHVWKTAGSLLEAGLEPVSIALLDYPVPVKHGKDISNYLAGIAGAADKRAAVAALIAAAIPAATWRKDHPEYKPRKKTAPERPPPDPSPDPDVPAVISHNELAKLFIKLRGAEFRFVVSAGVGVWMHWTDAEGWRDVHRHNHVVTSMSDLARVAWHRVDQRSMEKIYDAKTGGSDGVARGGINIAIADLTEDASAWNSDLCQIGLPDNRVLSLESGLVRRCRPDDRLTRTAAVAPALEWRGSPFDLFLQEKIPDGAARHWLQLAVGYSATGYTTEDQLVFVYGPTSTGKSTFIETISKALGDYASTIPSDIVAPSGRGLVNENRLDATMARCYDRHLVVMNEISPRGFLDTARLSSLTGGDRIQVRALHQNPIEIYPKFSLWWVGNHKPIMVGRHEEVFRRLRMIEFAVQHQGSRIDKQTRARLQTQESLAQVLAWIVEGAQLWHAEGRNMPEPTPRMVQLAAEYQTDSDTVGQWIGTNCDLGGTGEHDAELAKHLHKDFMTWREENGLSAHFTVRALVSALVEEHKCIREHTRDGTRLRGIALRAPAFTPQAPLGDRWMDR